MEKLRHSGMRVTPNTYNAATDPRDPLINLLWNKYFVTAQNNLGASSVDDAVRGEALFLMAQDRPGFAAAGLPGGDDEVALQARDDGVYTTGSKYLIGYFKPDDSNPANVQNDFATQRQNWTQIIHWNTGLGWELLRPKIISLMLVLDAEYETEPDKAFAVMAWLRDENLLTEEQLSEAETVGDYQAFRYLEKDPHWKELTTIAMLAKAWGGQNPSSLDIALAYDLASGEGMHLFGIDAFNDVIATEAGARMANELSTPGSTITSPATLKDRFEFHMSAARQALLNHPVMADKERVLNAFFTTQMHSQDGHFAPVRLQFGETTYTIWHSTLGTIAEKNKGNFVTSTWTTNWVNSVVYHVNAGSLEVHSGGVNLSQEDVTALHQIIEMLSLIDD